MLRPLADTHGRVHRDLRISVTDRCNLRCTYCMPEEGMEWQPRHELLSFEEIERVARVLVTHFGIDAIRLTGGEPTLRAHLPVLVERLAALGTDLSITTNATTLDRMAGDLAEAGLRRVNVSLDSLRRDRFQELTRRDDLPKVLSGIEAALAAGLTPVKLNVVAMRGVNDDEVVDLAAFGREKGIGVRFIEFMPLDASGAWERDAVVSQAEIVEAIDAVFPLEPLARGSAPATLWRYRDGGGDVGVIPSVTQPFCGDCDRIRLTSDGKLRTCLFATDETDLRALVRGGASDDDIAAVVAAAVGEKGPGHLIGQPAFIRPRRSMSQIGG
ncbi:GTP 3',8-cyclase MoaA [Iamia majanohamensis]|uniref:GTP 3',8-cyclase n=1 Tax=Iamia majanohamensis TaxID=467976 RepID=A0AAE9Y483_9ACTN|nr:GTP 3',8-cyclase MoaA [Iamia majanohamensis]WCO65944.1 GTP 3',8-cyclase MoaA [Iamia majanohamensis]